MLERFMKSLFVLLLLFACENKQVSTNYPEHWWSKVPQSELQWWEISPHWADKKSVVLSKRNELGILSNFAATAFTYKNKRYASVEGFWQAMKYPEDDKDERAKIKGWPHTRAEVEKMVAFEAKLAGDKASEIMKKHQIDWVSFAGEKFPYRDKTRGRHYQLIREAMVEKMRQNPEVKKILLSTGELNLLPDHKIKDNDPPAWKYFNIWMEIRSELVE